MKLSIIIAAYNIENFIEQALHSCRQADAMPCEVIVVDDCSTDQTTRVIERFAAAHGPEIGLRVIAKPANEGLGMARNTGLDAATGDYVLFLDGDDWFTEGFFHRIRAQVAQHDPDVVMFNHTRVYGSGKSVPNAMTSLLIERSSYPPEVRSTLINNFGVAWNKIYRRSFLESRGLRFAQGLYEDINWSFPILLTAKCLRTTPDIGVNYRQRSGSILRSTSPNHFDVLKQLRALLDTLRADPALLKTYRTPLYALARRQAFFVLDQGRVPDAMTGRFIREAFALIGEWRTATGADPRDLGLSVYQKTGATGFRIFAATRRALLEAAAWSRKKIENLRRSAYRLRGAIWVRQHKLLTKVLPIKPRKVLLDAYWSTKADCNPLAIARGLDRIGGYDLVWLLKPDVTLPPDVPGRVARFGKFAMYREAADAKYLISNVNFPTEFTKRPGSVHVQTFHGTPLKLMGLDIRERNPREMNWDSFLERCLRWDYAISSNPHSSYAWRRSSPYHYKMLETGYPRNDIFFTATEADRARIREALGIPEGKKVALYAPTMRDNLKGQSLAVTNDIFDADKVAAALGDDYVLLIRAHYFLTETDGSAHRAIDVSAYPSSNEIALITDVLITDYSSLMFDYACLRRPVVLYQYDYADYLARRGVYFEIRDVPPGPIVETPAALIECLSSRAFATDEANARINAFADRFAPWDDGKATDRVIAQIFGETVPPRQA